MQTTCVKTLYSIFIFVCFQQENYSDKTFKSHHTICDNLINSILNYLLVYISSSQREAPFYVRMIVREIVSKNKNNVEIAGWIDDFGLMKRPLDHDCLH